MIFSLLLQNFLKDYGYIEIQLAKNASDGDGKISSDQPKMPSSTQSTDRGQSKPDNADWKKGIKAFQRRYHIPVTGQIDSATKELMTKPRCGVPDYQVQIKPTGDGKSQDLSALTDESKKSEEEDKSGIVTSPAMITSTVLDGKQSGKSLLDPLSESAKSGKGMNKFPYRPPSVPEVKPSPEDISWGQYSIVEVSSEDDFEDSEIVDEDDVEDVPTTSIPEEEIDGTTMLTYTVTEVVSALVSELDSKTAPSTPKYPLSDNKDKDEMSGPRPKRDIRELLRQMISESNHRQRRDSAAGGQPSSSSGSGLRFSARDLPITWRVLDDYPSQYITDTSSIFTAAFRRWAEVTPLTFREQTSGDVLNVDIYIAFANSSKFNNIIIMLYLLKPRPNKIKSY